MTRALSYSPLGPTVQVAGHFDREAVARLSELLDHLASAASLVIELSRARSVDPSALVQLHDEVLRHRRLGRDVVIHGLTLAQSRLLELASGRRAADGNDGELAALLALVR